MIYLLIPIAVVFGLLFFGLGWYAHKPAVGHRTSAFGQNEIGLTKEQRCSPHWIYFKDNKRIFPSVETVDIVKHDCDTILHVEKCRGELTDIMVVFKSKFTAINGRLRDFNSFPRSS